MFEYKIRYAEIVDGDTIDAEIDLGFHIIKKDRIRLLGIDAPETRTKNLLEKQAGLAVSEVLNRIILESKDVRVRTYKGLDKYGRFLGDLICDDVSINQWMVSKGYAMTWNGRKHQWTQEELENIIKDTEKLSEL